MVNSVAWLRDQVHAVADFPRAGVTFRDVSPLLADGDSFRLIVELLADEFVGRDIDYVVGIDARGFIFGAAVACRLGVGFVPIRKAGKLPPPVVGVDYALEYGTARLELSATAFAAGDRVVVIDDVLATGGTVEASLTLLDQLEVVVDSAGFVVELPDLGGRARTGDIRTFTLMEF